MTKKIYNKEDWQEFRKEVLELVILYCQVKEYSTFDKDKIEYVKSFFYISQRNAITAFFIKVGFLVTNGTPTLKNFISKETYDDLILLYNKKVGLVRDKMYAHNAKSDKKMKDFSLSNEDVEEVYSKIISLAQEIDEKYDDRYAYEFINNAEGIKSISYYIERSIELDSLKKSIRDLGYKASVELSITTGKIKIVDGE
jgi:hypothetical protein